MSGKQWTWEDLAKMAIAANTADWPDAESKERFIAELKLIKRRLMLGDAPDVMDGKTAPLVRFRGEA